MLIASLERALLTDSSCIKKNMGYCTRNVSEITKYSYPRIGTGECRDCLDDFSSMENILVRKDLEQRK